MSSMKNVVVVIGTGGMGTAIIRRIGSGSKVVIADVDERQLSKVADTFRDDAYDVVPREVDVSDPHSVRQLAVDCAALGPVMTVVHTAGVSPVHASIQMILAWILSVRLLSSTPFKRLSRREAPAYSSPQWPGRWRR